MDWPECKKSEGTDKEEDRRYIYPPLAKLVEKRIALTVNSDTARRLCEGSQDLGKRSICLQVQYGKLACSSRPVMEASHVGHSA